MMASPYDGILYAIIYRSYAITYRSYAIVYRLYAAYNLYIIAYDLYMMAYNLYIIAYNLGHKRLLHNRVACSLYADVHIRLCRMLCGGNTESRVHVSRGPPDELSSIPWRTRVFLALSDPDRRIFSDMLCSRKHLPSRSILGL